MPVLSNGALRARVLMPQTLVTTWQALPDVHIEELDLLIMHIQVIKQADKEQPYVR